jgi:hypothetical protein
MAESEFFQRTVPLTLIEQAKRAEARRSVMDAIMNQKQKLTDEMMLFDSTGKCNVSKHQFMHPL